MREERKEAKFSSNAQSILIRYINTCMEMKTYLILLFLIIAISPSTFVIRTLVGVEELENERYSPTRKLNLENLKAEATTRSFLDNKASHTHNVQTRIFSLLLPLVTSPTCCLLRIDPFLTPPHLLLLFRYFSMLSLIEGRHRKSRYKIFQRTFSFPKRNEYFS